MQETTALKEERRALIVEKDPETRRGISDVLMNRGFLVSACDSLEKGREFYRAHTLVVTGCREDNGNVQRFVDFVRQTSGATQPYIITLKDATEVASSFPGPGVNDLLGIPLDERILSLKMEAADAWLASRDFSPKSPVTVVQAVEEVIEEIIPVEEFEVEEEILAEAADDTPDDGDDDDFEIEYETDEIGDFGEFLIAPAEQSVDAEVAKEPEVTVEIEEIEEVIVNEQQELPVEEAPQTEPKSPAGTTLAPANTLRYHMSQLIETVPYGMALFDTGMNYRVANHLWQRSFGLENDTVIGRSHYEIFADVPAPWRKCCQRAIETDSEQIDLELVEWADGTRERVRWIMRPWHYESGESGGVVVSFETVEDTTANRPENAVATDLASALAQSTTAPVLVLDSHGRIVRSNLLAREMGIWNEVSDQERFYWKVYLAKEKRPPVQDAFIHFTSRIIEIGEFAFPATTVDTIPCADGTSRTIAWHNLPRHAADGKVNGMIRIGVDVDELAAESTPQTILTDERWLDLLPTLHWKARRDGKIIFFSKAWLDFRGRASEEEIDNGWMDGLHEADHSRLIESFTELEESGGRLNQVARLQNANGEYRWMRFAILPDKYSNSPDGGVFVGFCEDITAQKNYEAQLSDFQGSDAELRSGNSELTEALAEVRGELDFARQTDAERMELVTESQSKFAVIQQEYDTMLGESAKIADSIRVHEENETRLQTELNQLKNDLSAARETNDTLKMERGRFAAIPENAPFGIIVLSRDGHTIYTNPAHKQVVGSDIQAKATFEEWLQSRCPEDTDEARAKLLEQWRKHVWRGHHTYVFSLTSDDDSLRDLEIRPKMMRDGQFLLSIFDITDSRRGETALRTSEAKFRTLFYDSGVAMALVDRKGAVVDANSAAVRLFGKSKTDISKKRITDFIVESDRPRREELIEHLQLSQQRTGDIALSVLAADGTEKPVQMNVSFVRDGDGEPIFTAYFFHPQVAIAAEPTVEETSSGPDLEESPDLILVTDLAGTIERLIPSAKFSKQIDKSEAIGMKVAVLFPGLKTTVAELGARATQSGGVIVHPFKIMEKDGEHAYECRISCSGSSHLAIIVREAPAVPKAPAPAPATEAASAPPVDDNMKRQALAFSSLQDAVVVADLKGHIANWNKGAETLFGYTSDEITGKGLFHLFDQEQPKRFKTRITQGITKHRRWKETTTFIHKDGSTGTCEVDYVPLLDENGTPVALIGTNRPAEKESPSDRKPAIPQPKAKETPDAGLAAVSEKNLTAIAEMLELQVNGTHERSARKAISASNGRVRALTMLQKQAAESGDLKQIDFGKYVRNLVQELLDRVGPEDTAIEVHLNAKNVFLPIETAAPLASCVNELITNSLSHAFEDRADGVVTIGVRLNNDGTGRLFVRDDGIGLPEWLDIKKSPGLGIQIAQKFAAQLQGSVRVPPGDDTEFQVQFKTQA